MIDVVDRQEELEVMLVDPATIFRTPVRQYPQHRRVVFFVERQYPVVEKVSGGDRRLRAVELGVGDLGIGIDIGLLIYATYALQRANIERILRTKVAWVSGVNLTAGVCRANDPPDRFLILRTHPASSFPMPAPALRSECHLPLPLWLPALSTGL